MKTSHILLIIITIVTLTGMVATDVLLTRQYKKVDWRNPYQNFERRALPPVRHLVIDAAPIAEVIVEKSDSPQALLLPAMANSYQSRQQSDTLFISFKMNYKGSPRNPRNNSYELSAGLVVRLPAIESLKITNGCLTVRRVTTGPLAISMWNSRLRLYNLAVSDTVDLIENQNSYAILGNDRYPSLRAIVKDSSGIQLNNTQVDTFTKDVSPKAEVQLLGQALKWLK